MRVTLLAGLFVTASLTALAQGKVILINDSASLVMFWNGQPLGNQVPLPSGVMFQAGLYGGTSSSSLFLYSTAPVNDQSGIAPPGSIQATHIVLSAQPNGAPAIAGIASGTAIGAGTPWFQVKVWDASYATYEAAVTAGSGYTGEGAEFQLDPGPSIIYTFTAPPGPNSTWVEAPIYVGPEPSTLALIGLGAATLWIFRRRK